MAFTSPMPDELREILQNWEMSDQANERKIKKFLADGLDTFIKAKSDILSIIPEGPPLDVPVYRWMEELDYPDEMVGTLDDGGGTPMWALDTSQTLLGKTGGDLTDSFMKNIIREGAILRRQSDGLLLVTIEEVGDTTTGEVKVACYDGRTIIDNGGSPSDADEVEDDAAATTYEIIGERWSDWRDASNYRSLDRSFEKVGTQIFADAFAIGKTRQNMSMEIVENETLHQIEALLRKLRRRLARAVVIMEPHNSNTWLSPTWEFSDEDEDSTMAGLNYWFKKIQQDEANTEIFRNGPANDGATGDPTWDSVCDLTRGMRLTEGADFDTGNWKLLCHPNTWAHIALWQNTTRRTDRTDKGVGYTVTEIMDDQGKVFPVVSDVYMPKGEIWCVDFSKQSYGYFTNDKMERQELPRSGRYHKWLISFQAYGLVCRMKRQALGKIYNLTKTLPS